MNGHSRVMNDNITKANIVRTIAIMTGLPRNEVELSVEAFMNVTKRVLRQGHTVTLRGFGKFKPFERKEKPGNLPHWKGMIPAKRVVKFYPSKRYFKMESVS